MFVCKFLYKFADLFDKKHCFNMFQSLFSMFSRLLHFYTFTRFSFQYCQAPTSFLWRKDGQQLHQSLIKSLGLWLLLLTPGRSPVPEMVLFGELQGSAKKNIRKQTTCKQNIHQINSRESTYKNINICLKKTQEASNIHQHSCRKSQEFTKFHFCWRKKATRCMSENGSPRSQKVPVSPEPARCPRTDMPGRRQQHGQREY